MTLRFDLHVTQGETFSVVVPVLTENGDPANLVGVSARAQIRYTASTALLHEWSSAAGNLTVGTGSITLSVSAETSSSWAWRRGSWDLELTDGVTTTRLVQGSVTVNPEITR